jgi:hypothetical protein
LASADAPVLGVSTRRHAGVLRVLPPERVALILIPIGAFFGPLGLGLLSEPLLTMLEPALAASLTAVGLFVGLDINARAARPRVVIAAAIGVSVTVLAVAGGLVAARDLVPEAANSPALLFVIGMCAAASVSASHRAIATLDQIFAIVTTGLVFVLIRDGAFMSAAWLVVRAALLAVVIAAAGWLLVSQTASDGEQRVFTIGALLLLGGAAAQLSLSPLLIGLTAGACWNALGSEAGSRVRRDLDYLRHPLTVLLLLTAGARLQPASSFVAAAAVYTLGRAVGKTVGGRLTAAVAGLPAGAGVQLLPPGLVAIAVALAALQPWDYLFAIVVIGSLGSELASWALSEPERA